MYNGINAANNRVILFNIMNPDKIRKLHNLSGLKFFSLSISETRKNNIK